MKIPKLLFIFTTGIILFLNSGCVQKTVSIETLLNEMVDRNELARFPEPAFELIVRPEESYRMCCAVLCDRKFISEETIAHVGPQRHKNKEYV